MRVFLVATIRIFRAELHVETIRIASRIMEQLLYEIDFQARIRASVGPYSVGNLADRMYKVGPVVTGDRVSGRVGNRAPYAASVNDGASIHAIFPKRGPHVYRFGSYKRPQLRFYWRKAGKVVFMPHIPGSAGRIGRSHPGQKAKRFLTDAMVDVARRHGLHVTVHDFHV